MLWLVLGKRLLQSLPKTLTRGRVRGVGLVNTASMAGFSITTKPFITRRSTEAGS